MHIDTIVYIIDDNESVTTALRHLVESVGYRVKVYNDARIFLNQLDASKISCAIVDVCMPEMSGPELQEALLKKGINMPLIFHTSISDVPVAVRAMKLGAIDFLTKPTNAQILLETINKALRSDTRHRKKQEKNADVIAREKRLSLKERKVMHLIVSGESTKWIENHLNFSVRTVEMHRANIIRKMEVKSQVELTSMILRYELLPKNILQKIDFRPLTFELNG